MASKIEHLVFDNKELPIEFEMIDVDSEYAQSKKNLASPHRASFYCIIWFKTGDVIHLVDFNPVSIRANTLLFIRKDAIQFFDHHNKFSSQIILFTDNFFCRNISDHQFLKSTSLFNDLMGNLSGGIVEGSALLRQLWEWMEKEFKHGMDHYKSDMLKNYLHNFILVAEREKNRHGGLPIQHGIQLDYLLSFKDYLERYFPEQQSVAFYAQKLSITAKVLTLATQKVIGKTPKQVIDERVLLEAKRLLIHSNETGKSVGYSLGFEEPTNFIKYFRKHTGYTPTTFRAKYLS